MKDKTDVKINNIMPCVSNERSGSFSWNVYAF